MGVRSSRYSILRLASTSFVLSLLTILAVAQQQPRVLAPHDPVAPRVEKRIPQTPVPGSIAGGPWIVDANFRSVLYLKNVVETASITVTPVLYLSNGAKYQLTPVQLEASGISKVDIGASLDSLGVTSNARLSGWIELQYNWPWDPLCAMVRDIDETHSIIFSFGFAAPGPFSLHADKTIGPQVREGMWWKQEKNVTGFLTLANTTSHAIDAHVELEDNQGSIFISHAITVPPQGMETLDLWELQTAASNEGGIRVRYAGTPDALLVNGGLEDIGIGYSANLPFTGPERQLPPMAHALQPQSIVELGLMTGAADPWMSFPAGTIFTPYSILRNVSVSPISVTPTLWWMHGSAPASFPLPSVRLLPNQTYSLDMPSLLTAAGLKNLSGSVNLVFDTQGQTGLLMASGSVDQTNTYVFEVTPRGSVMSAGKNLSYWSTANGDDTMVTIWNPTDEAQTFIFRLMFAGGHYDDLMTLDPRATRMFDVSEIIATAGSDPEGNIIPAGVQEGSAKIVGIEADNQHILLAVDSGTYNVRKATCSSTCTTCDGSTLYLVSLDPFILQLGGQTQEHLYAQWDTGAQYDYTNSSSTSWTSSNTSVATVKTGLVASDLPGTLTISSATSGEPVYGQLCGSDAPSCPIAGGGGGSSPGTVTPTVTFSPLQTVVAGQSATVTATVNTNGSTNSQTITLTLSSSGTGSATFSNGSTTMSITSTTTATVKGIHPSSSAADTKIDATISASEGSGAQSVATNPQSFSIVAIPVNFSASSGASLSDGTLEFTYTWQSSTGNLQDLSSCRIGEQVAYPTTSSPYIWPYPMVQSSTNPTIIVGPGNASLQDKNSPPNSYSTPYSPGGSFIATQYLIWECPLYNNGNYQDFVPAISITRSVNKNQSTNLWQYQITKSGYTNTVVLPNQ